MLDNPGAFLYNTEIVNILEYVCPFSGMMYQEAHKSM